jgi:MscS family membrane protein
MIPSVVYILGSVLFFTPKFYSLLTEGLWGLNYIALTTLVWGGFRWLTEWVIKLERLKTDSTDSQLIRLGSRLLALAIAIAILIEGANRIGLPSYSIMAGLGIGGLAVALAGQQALANLLGSLIIMFEKPFRIGHSIKAGSIEGQVENIGFRTTQLRTADGTTLIVPSSEIIRTPIENLTLRKHWRVKKSLKVGLSTSLEALSNFKFGIEALLKETPGVNEKSIRISLAEILAEGLEIRIEFTLEVKNSAEQLNLADAVLTRILDLARTTGIRLDPEEPLVAPRIG